MPVDVTAESLPDTLSESTVPVLVDFWAVWCGPCRAMAPALERVDAEADGRYRVVKVDVDQDRSVVTTYGLQSVPTLILFGPGGEEIARHSGALPLPDLRALVAQAGV